MRRIAHHELQIPCPAQTNPSDHSHRDASLTQRFGIRNRPSSTPDFRRPPSGKNQLGCFRLRILKAVNARTLRQLTKRTYDGDGDGCRSPTGESFRASGRWSAVAVWETSRARWREMFLPHTAREKNRTVARCSLPYSSAMSGKQPQRQPTQPALIQAALARSESAARTEHTT